MKNINEIVEKIKAENALFEAATPEQKRVMIAGDVIAWIETKRLHASKNRIVIFGSTEYEGGETDRTTSCGVVEKVQVDGDKSVQELLFENEVSCEVCAKGALFMAIVGRVNEVKVYEATGTLNNNSFEMQKVRNYFSEKQMSMIEYAFEGAQHVDSEVVTGAPISFTTEQHGALIDFYDSFDTSEECLLAIMRNIIHNNGEFVL